MASNSSLKQMLATISSELLDQVVNDARLAEIANKLVFWKRVCSYLKIDHAEETEIEEDYSAASTRRYVGFCLQELSFSFLCESNLIV